MEHAEPKFEFLLRLSRAEKAIVQKLAKEKKCNQSEVIRALILKQGGK